MLCTKEASIMNVKLIIVPGDMNVPVHISASQLSVGDVAKMQQGYKLHNFNQFASDKISVHRKLPDFRDQK